MNDPDLFKGTTENPVVFPAQVVCAVYNGAVNLNIPSNNRENRVLLVGNGRSLLDRRGLGTLIDSYPIVVRFNNFVTTGFEAFVGQKTNWWARAENPDILPRTEPLQRILLRL